MINIPAIPEGINFLLSYEGHTDIAKAVAADLYNRHKFGLEKYGVALTPDNGRNNFRDIYEEILDAYNYTVNSLLLKNINVGTLSEVPTWGTEEGNSDTRVLFELLIDIITMLKTLKGRFSCN